MDNKKILFISQEITPYVPSTPLSDTGRVIPEGIIGKGFEVRTFMPKYGNINERRNQLHEVIRLSGMNIIIDDNDHQLIIKVATLQPSRMQVYFIDNDDYFQHHQVSDIELRQTPGENDERIMFFIRGVVETVKKLRWEPAVVHNMGWISALTPLYLKRIYKDDPSFRSSKIVYSLVHDDFEGHLDDRFVEKLRMEGFTDEDLGELTEGPIDYKALNRVAMRYADGIVDSMPDTDPELVEYARNSGKPFLPYISQDDAYAQAYIDFYESL